ncbi:predicted protein [Sclerotinia sclerotiorum 1980 UF-70]|nr:predicted protein [Sclerotinia sclerotiorum 1980 UF-70]EDN96302.1 predicted protein [Sclerotinia sclerotiorum 1980 UF-70]
MGETWDIQHGEPGTRSEKLRLMLKGLRVHDVSPSIKGHLLYKSQLQAREDYYNNPDHLFPPAAKTLAEFEKNDDDWWRLEVAAMTMNDLFEKLEDADDVIAEEACETILRIGGADGTGSEYWPEGAQNPFANQPRTQEPIEEDEEEDRRKQEEKDRIGKALREQTEKIMEEMRQKEEEMERLRQKNLPPPLPPRSNLRPPPLPPRPGGAQKPVGAQRPGDVKKPGDLKRPVDVQKYKTYNP